MSTETAILVGAIATLWVLVFIAVFLALWLPMRDRRVRSVHLGFYLQRDRPEPDAVRSFADHDADTKEDVV